MLIISLILFKEKIMPEYLEPKEIPLAGGRMTAGVMRVGDTVRRPLGGLTDLSVHLLRHFEQIGFTGAPRYLGRDQAERDILTYIPGWVPTKFQYFRDEQIFAAGTLIRQFHNATRGSSLAGSSAVVCHNDPAPNNAVFQNEMPVAFIDFDMVSPGDPLEDLGYMAWLWCVSSKPERAPVSKQAGQVRVLADAYGLDATSRSTLVEAMLERQSRNATFWTDRLSDFHGPPTSQAQMRERVRWSEVEKDFVNRHREEFDRALR